LPLPPEAIQMVENPDTTPVPEQIIRVEIFDHPYNIRSDGDNAYIHELASYVDTKMREISSGTQTVDSIKVAILAALHIADELYQLKSSHTQVDGQLAVRSSECSEMLDRILRHRESDTISS
jgi:cell division protein ZapA